MARNVVAKNEKDVVIVSAVRTPFGKYGGVLKDVPSIDLASIVMKEALKRVNLPAEKLEEIYYGSCEPIEYGMEINVPARQALLKAGFPASTEYPKLLPSSQDWLAEYRQRYNSEPMFYGPHNYVDLIILAFAFNKAGSTDKEKLIAAMESIDTMTPMGHLKFFKNEFGAIHQGFKI